MNGYSKKFAERLKPILEDKVFTVSEIIEFLNGLIKPCKVTVQGEVGEDINMYPRFGFFKLIDEEGSSLPCFGFKNVFNQMGLDLEPGMKVKVYGYPEIRKKKGSFNFQVKRISPVGEGDLKKQFEILKKKLKKEGFFDEDKKQKIPTFPQKIGLITSKGSDAEKDFFTHLEEYGFEVFTYNSRVEGDQAISDVISGIETLNKNYPHLEAIVITRGGGSWESLQAFNSEEVVKAAFSSKIPVISGIGHENDLSLLDLVADKRVSTPTDAGKFLSESWKEGEKYIMESEKNLSGATMRMIGDAERRFDQYKINFERKIKQNLFQKVKNLNYIAVNLSEKIKNKINQFQSLVKEFKSHNYKLKTKIKISNQKISDLSKNLEQNEIYWQKAINKKIKEEEKKLNLSSPDLKLKQGYSITKSNGKLVKSIREIDKNSLLETTFKDGVVESKVENKSNK